MPLGFAVVAFAMIAMYTLGGRGVDIGIFLASAAVPYVTSAVNGF